MYTILPTFSWKNGKCRKMYNRIIYLSKSHMITVMMLMCGHHFSTCTFMPQTLISFFYDELVLQSTLDISKSEVHPKLLLSQSKFSAPENLIRDISSLRLLEFKCK